MCLQHSITLSLPPSVTRLSLVTCLSPCCSLLLPCIHRPAPLPASPQDLYQQLLNAKEAELAAERRRADALEKATLALAADKDAAQGGACGRELVACCSLHISGCCTAGWLPAGRVLIILKYSFCSFAAVRLGRLYMLYCLPYASHGIIRLHDVVPS